MNEKAKRSSSKPVESIFSKFQKFRRNIGLEFGHLDESTLIVNVGERPEVSPRFRRPGFHCLLSLLVTFLVTIWNETYP